MTSNVETTMHKNVTLSADQVRELAVALAIRAAVLDAEAKELRSLRQAAVLLRRDSDDFRDELLTTRAYADECRAISIALRNGGLVPLEPT